MDWFTWNSRRTGSKRTVRIYTWNRSKRKQDWGDRIGDAIFQRKGAIDKAVAAFTCKKFKKIIMKLISRDTVVSS